MEGDCLSLCCPYEREDARVATRRANLYPSCELGRVVQNRLWGNDCVRCIRIIEAFRPDNMAVVALNG